MTSTLSVLISPIYPIIFTLFGVFLVLATLVALLGMLIGIFTYGRKPAKKKLHGSEMDQVLEFGESIMHYLIDIIKGKSDSTWLNDQQLLAMLRGMSPSEFELFIAKMFSALGYKTRVVGGSSDGGVDIEMTKDGRNHVVQCKKFVTRKVNPHDVRDFFGAMGDRHVTGKGFFITTNIFTHEAEEFAEKNAIEWVDGQSLIKYVRKSGIQPHATTINSSNIESCPLCGKSLIVRVNRDNGNRFMGCAGFPNCHFTKNL